MLLRLILILGIALSPFTADADERAVRDRIVRELRDDGYNDIRLFRTFLGRLRFVGEDGRSRREIIVSPTTGVILRDYVRFFDLDDDEDDARDDEDDDDDFDDDEDGDEGDEDDDDESDDAEDDDESDDDDDESDNSGSGSSNSGSGSSGGDDDDD